MSDSLGLSIGMTNLVAARMGRPPVMRRSVLTVFDDRAPEVGVPSENPNLNQPGMVLSGFVERVGDPVPLVAADGSPHRGERVLVEALDAMARTVGGGTPVVIAVPAHWGQGTVDALRGALAATPSLAPGGVAPALVPDSVAALSALQAAPGLPPNGVVVLCDFGGSGTSITLADAASGFNTIGETVRYAEFSGDQIDQALLNHVVAGIADAGNSDPASTAAVGSLARLRNDCRLAKEQLSARDRDRRTRRPSRVRLRCPGDPQRAGTAHRATPERGAGHRRRGVAAQQTFRPPASRRWRLSVAVRTSRWSPSSCPLGCVHPSSPLHSHSSTSRPAPRSWQTPPRRRRGWPLPRIRPPAWPRLRRAGRPAPPDWQPPHRLPTRRTRRRFGRWRGHRTTRRPANPCPTPARTTPSNKARPVRFGHRWSSATKKRATRRNRDRCPGTSGRRFCSGRPQRRCCWPSAASRSP